MKVFIANIYDKENFVKLRNVHREKCGSQKHNEADPLFSEKICNRMRSPCPNKNSSDFFSTVLVVLTSYEQSLGMAYRYTLLFRVQLQIENNFSVVATTTNGGFGVEEEWVLVFLTN